MQSWDNTQRLLLSCLPKCCNAVMFAKFEEAYLTLEVLEVRLVLHSCCSNRLLGGGRVLGIEGGGSIHSNGGWLFGQARLDRLDHVVLLACGIGHHCLLIALNPCASVKPFVCKLTFKLGATACVKDYWKARLQATQNEMWPGCVLLAC